LGEKYSAENDRVLPRLLKTLPAFSFWQPNQLFFTGTVFLVIPNQLIKVAYTKFYY